MPAYDVGYYTFSVSLVPEQANIMPGNWTFELCTSCFDLCSAFP